MARITDVLLPDIGDFEAVDVIEVLVAPGDRVQKDDSLVTLESDKASMEIPSPYAGVVKSLEVQVGDQVSQGNRLLTLEVAEEAPGAAEPSPGPSPEPAAPAGAQPPPTERPPAQRKAPGATSALPGAPPPSRPPVPPLTPAELSNKTRKAHASPSVRRYARELGVDLTQVPGSGPKGRVVHGDVQGFVKKVMSRSTTTAPMGLAMPEMPVIDFSRFGEVETQPLSRIRRKAGANLHRSWISVPHVTQFDEADITELEGFRRSQRGQLEGQGVKLTLLSFLMKASVVALKAHPSFNASLTSDGEGLVLKRYYHLGIAVDTPDGLVVPVVRNVDQKGLFELAAELAELSGKAREGRLTPSEMQGASFSISSLGGIGGTGFTPIVNAPEVAILGISRASKRPIYHDDALVPRLILPLSLSYDHRVIDGAAAARFTTTLGTVLSDIRHMLL